MAEDKSETSPSGEGEKKIAQENAPPENKKDDEVEEEKKIEENGEAKPKENGEGDKPTPEPKDMRAIVATGFGGLKSVKVLRKPEPTLADNEVLIRVKACGLNFQDLMTRLGVIDSCPKPPFILGSECAGEVEQVGENVENIKVGDRVVALPENKAWTELVAVPKTAVFVIPEEMSYLDAVAITLNYTIANILLFDLAQLTPGKSLFLHNAGGGVGQAIVQLARTVKDVTIFGVCGKIKHEKLKESGTIDHILERGSDYNAEVKKVCPGGVDIVLDSLCSEECNKGVSLLKPMGRFILYGSSNVVTGETKSFFSAARSWLQVDRINKSKLFEENKTVSGFNFRHLIRQPECHEYVQENVNAVFRMWKEGVIKPVIDSTWALEDAIDAMQKMHDRKNIGKILLDPNMEPKPKPATPAKGKAKDKKNASNQEEKKSNANHAETDNGEKKPELTNGVSEDKSDSSESKEKESV